MPLGGQYFPYSEAKKKADPNDFSDRYNTTLSPEEEAQFQKWAQQQGREGDVYGKS